MLDMDAFREFRQGLTFLREGDPEAAAKLLLQATQREPENPYYLSYYGLSVAQAEGNWTEAERLCHTALCRARRQAQLYLNLAEVYLASGHRQAAADTLARALRYMPHDVRLQTEYGRLMERKLAVLKFLPRGHVLNRNLGRLRHQILQHIPRRRWLQVGEPGPQQARAHALGKPAAQTVKSF